MTMPATPPATTWTVTSQTEQTQISAGGQPVRGVVVYFQTGQGHSGSVFIPYAQYNADYVRQQVASAAQQMDAIGSLSSGPASS